MYTIHRMGVNSIHPADYHVNRPKGYPWYLLLLIKTPAEFYLDNKKNIVRENSLIIYDKLYPHRYRGLKDKYIDDWIHFDLDPFSPVQLQLPLNTLIILSQNNYLRDLISNVSREYYSTNNSKDQTVDLLMQLIFVKAREYAQKDFWPPDPHKNLIELRSNIYSNPQYDWSVPMMAGFLNISCGHLQAIYKSTFNTTCMKEVIQSRIIHAKELLVSTNYYINEISRLCGYKCEVHFMRQFKKTTSMTPSDYRKARKGRINGPAA